MNEENFVFIKEGNKVMCGGYEINNTLLKGGMPAIANVKKGGGSLDTLAIPAGLFLLQQQAKQNPKPFMVMEESEPVVSDDLYDRLLSLMTVGDKKKSLTRKRRKKGKRSTRRKR